VSERDDDTHLRLACRLATESASSDGGPFGAVIVSSGTVVATGTNRVTATSDPTAHAEMEAMRAAGVALGRHRLDGCVLYVSCQPCPMCMTAAWWSGVDRIVYAATAEAASEAGFADGALWEAVGHPDSAPVPPEHHPHPAEADPFRAWAANPDRLPY
jgi:guanine deaminase